MTTLGSATPAIFSTSTGDGSGVTVVVGHALPRRVHGDPGRPPARIAREPRPDERDDARRSRTCSASRATTASPRSSRTSGSSFDAVANNPGDPGAAHGADPSGDDARVELQLRGELAPADGDERDHAARRAGRAGQHDLVEPGARSTSRSRAARSPGLNVNTLEDQRDQLAQTLAQLTGATIQQGQNNQVTVTLGGLNLVAGEPVAGAARSTRAARPRCCAPTQGGFAAERHVGSGRRDAQRHQHGDPGLPDAARRRRDDVARSGQQRR